MIRNLLAAIAGMLAGAALIVTFAPWPVRDAGKITGPARSPEAVASQSHARDQARRRLETRAGGQPTDAAQILFGDLHVHSTFSIDAFAFSLPLFAGEGAHPPADACDFARYCSQLDFYSMNDHAEGLTPARWAETLESVRQCNARAGDSANPDLVAFNGFEWTQVGATPQTHYGHRNVIFPGLDASELPARPITALSKGVTDRARAMGLVAILEKLGPLGLGEYADFLALTRQIAELPDCESGVDTRKLPVDCRESAETPAALFAKLAQWGFERLVIPHGLAWGVHAPAGATLDVVLESGNHDPGAERLVEIMSGHGNGEEFRPDAQRSEDETGAPVCAAPSDDFYPCCWRAGEIIRDRCGDLASAECEKRVEEARSLALQSDLAPDLVIPDTQPEDWLDCDQCRDCFKPAMNLRPRQSAQYALTLADSVRWGFIASTDNHTSRPGTGYKQYARKRMADARGFASERIESWLEPITRGTQRDRQRAQAATQEPRSLAGLIDVERGASFMYPGGVVAVHAAARDRRSIWDALMKREVYGTSGPRILLWFSLTNGPEGRAPMGSEVRMIRAPEFEARAVGAFIQQPGCSEESQAGLSAARLERLCGGECYHPSDQRHPIEAIEIVRVRSAQPGDDPAMLIDDPWQRFECPPDPAGCAVTFSDPEFSRLDRTVSYYARALQVPTPAINANTLRATRGADGNVVSTRPCHGTFRTDADDDCLAPVSERAWSSPIWVDSPRRLAPPALP
jgi:hypothetical protein